MVVTVKTQETYFSRTFLKLQKKFIHPSISSFIHSALSACGTRNTACPAAAHTPVRKAVNPYTKKAHVVVSSAEWQ